MASIFTFIPVPLMIIAGPLVVIILSSLGWISMVGVAPLSMSYMIQSCREGVHGKIITVLGCICQFFFTLDVIAVIVLALKEKRFVKLTISLCTLVVTAVIIGMIWIFIKVAAM